MMRRWTGRYQRRRFVLLLIAALSLSGCDSLAYYGQAVQGQASVLFKRQSISALLADSDLDAGLRHKFNVVVAAREFAADALGLPAHGSYTSYVELDRPHMVWNVFAAPEFSTETMTWCFPVAGCVAYRGYFSEASAQNYARRLQSQGLDVYVGGVDAYSTLGWFRDPIPSSIMRRDDYQLAGLIFHELAHQRLYVPGDTTFNEGFASFVEQEGLRRWLASEGTPEVFDRFVTGSLRQQAFVRFVTDYRDRFASLYSQDMAPDMLREQKALLQAQMREDWRNAEELAGYAGWFSGPLNNAQLATVGSYHDRVAAFEQLLIGCDNSLACFYAEAEALAQLPATQRAERLDSLQADAAADM
jgi:predicted aminopeptidase